MVSYADMIASNTLRPAVFVTIEGFGLCDGSTDSYRFCLSRPAYAVGNYVEALLEPPDVLSEQVDLFGGTVTSGGMTIRLADTSGTVSGMMRVAAPSVTALAEDLDGSTSPLSFDVYDATNITTNTAIYIGAEVMRVTGKSGNTITCSRGQLNSDLAAHYTGDHVRNQTSFVIGRRVFLYIGTHKTQDEQLISTYVIRGIGWDHGSKVITFDCESQLYALDAIVPPHPVPALAVRTATEDQITTSFGGKPGGGVYEAQWPSTSSYFRIGDEIIAGTPNGKFGLIAGLRRGILGTTRGSGGEGLQLVFCAEGGTEISSDSSFRYSPGGNLESGASVATLRNSGTWRVSTHFVDIMLAILTSPSSSSDPNTVTTNKDNNYGNWACLPPGYGLGFPISSIDLASFLKVKDETPDIRFNAFVYGDNPKPFRELMDESFLKLTGCYLYSEGGKLYLSRPKLPEASTSPAFALTTANVFADSIELSTDASNVVGSVSYELSSKDGEPYTVTLSNDLVEQSFGQSNKYQSGAFSRSIPARGMMIDYMGGGSAVGQFGLALLARYKAPAITMACDVHPSMIGVSIGDVGTVTFDTFPDLYSGGSGVSSLWAQCVEKEISFSDGLKVHLVLLVFSETVSPRKVCPTVKVTAYTGGTWLVTCAANRYTSYGLQTGGPAKDVSAFTVGDVVQLVDIDGSSLSSNTETVVNVNAGANQITLSGEFDSPTPLAANTWLTFANYDDSVTAQKNSWAYQADGTDFTLVTSDAAAVIYGD